MKKLFFSIVCLTLISTSPAFAHPFLEESIPPASTTVGSGVEQVIIHFSEAVDVDFSNIKVLDSSGNQIDDKNTQYFEKKSSLMVTTPPLEDGVYTVTTKVLSKIDGHLVDYAFIFGIGDVQLDTSVLDEQENYESVFIPESLARFPGLVGQTIVLGIAISSFLIWKPLHKIRFFEDKIAQIESKFDEKFSAIFAIGIIAVLVSNITMIGVQIMRLDASFFDAVQTTFGNTWLVRMGITIALFALWFVFSRIKISLEKQHATILVLSLLLIGTTTWMGHGAASEHLGAVVLDYAHNLLAAVWIGGVVFLCFVLLPTFSKLVLEKRDQATLASIPRFSTIAVMSLGILFVTGPTLLWFFESNVNSLTNSSYGLFLIAKIVIGIGMISLGGYNQFKIFKDGERNISTSKIFQRLNKTLRIEVVLGMGLLFFVAFLTNTGLPAGEINLATATTISDYRFVEYTENTKFDISLDPFTTGKNALELTITDLNGNPLPDLVGTKIKVSNPAKNITPIEIPMEEYESGSFRGEVTFGFSSTWNMLIEAQRSQQANENIRLNVLVKPHLENIKTTITEIEIGRASCRERVYAPV